jgi:hypothetical protein
MGFSGAGMDSDAAAQTATAANTIEWSKNFFIPDFVGKEMRDARDWRNPDRTARALQFLSQKRRRMRDFQEVQPPSQLRLSISFTHRARLGQKMRDLTSFAVMLTFLASILSFFDSKCQLPELCVPATLAGMITVESDDREIRVTIPRGDLEISQVEAILRPFRFASLIAGSQMSKAEAVKIAEESKADWWGKNEKRFVPPEP